MKRVLLISTISITLVMGIVISLILIARKPDNADLKIEPVLQVNYNNYVMDNRIDYKGQQFAFQSHRFIGQKLTLMDGNESSCAMTGITAPFQLLDNRVVFIKNSTLFYRPFDSNRNTKIADNVSSFVATADSIIYLAGNSLFQYSWDSNDDELLKNDVYRFVVMQDQIVTIAEDGSVVIQKPDGNWQELCKLQIEQYPVNFMVHDCVLVYLNLNELRYVDLNTGKADSIPLVNGDYTNHRINFICDDTKVYVVIQFTQTNGSVVTDVDHERNGLWCVDLESKSMTKVGDDVFNRLYLFEDKLFGENKNQIFQIDTFTGEAKKIAG